MTTEPMDEADRLAEDEPDDEETVDIFVPSSTAIEVGVIDISDDEDGSDQQGVLTVTLTEEDEDDPEATRTMAFLMFVEDVPDFVNQLSSAAMAFVLTDVQNAQAAVDGNGGD